ncbi:MAG: PHP domain-containing protein [Eubacterium sp.]|nr:PHP domain-containing protein [Eubacterium sp.]
MSFNEKIDLHMHTTVSDGSDTPEKIITLVKKAGIHLFSVTDHDAVKGCQVIQEKLSDDDPAFICGAEFSCRDQMGKYHILGYHYDPEADAIRRLVDRSHGLRMRKVAARLDFIREEFGCVFPEEEIDALLSLDNPGKPHIGNLMVKYGYADSKETAINEYINKLRIKMEYVNPREAVEGILGSGGIPVLAHPFFGDGDQMIIGDEMEARLKRLMDFGLMGVEAFYSGFSPKLTREMLEFADRFDLLVTAGSDYHGSNKLVRLGDTGMTWLTPVKGMRKFLDRIGF